MSTTWVFLGLLAGRELAMTLTLRHRETLDTGRLVVGDASRAVAGLAVSVLLAFGLPLVHARLQPDEPPSVQVAQASPDSESPPVSRPEPEPEDPEAR